MFKNEKLQQEDNPFGYKLSSRNKRVALLPFRIAHSPKKAERELTHVCVFST